MSLPLQLSVIVEKCLVWLHCSHLVWGCLAKASKVGHIKLKRNVQHDFMVFLCYLFYAEEFAAFVQILVAFKYFKWTYRCSMPGLQEWNKSSFIVCLGPHWSCDWQETSSNVCTGFAENIIGSWLKVVVKIFFFLEKKRGSEDEKVEINILFSKVHIAEKWQQFYFEVNSAILAWLNFSQMIRDFSLTVMNYIYWLNYASIELFFLAVGIEWDWMT